MSDELTTEVVWAEIERNNFAVLGMVTARHQARTVGIVYVVDDHRLYIGAGADQWKIKHVAQNGDVSMTIPIAKRVPLDAVDQHPGRDDHVPGDRSGPGAGPNEHGVVRDAVSTPRRPQQIPPNYAWPP